MRSDFPSLRSGLFISRVRSRATGIYSIHISRSQKWSYTDSRNGSPRISRAEAVKLVEEDDWDDCPREMGICGCDETDCPECSRN